MRFGSCICFHLQVKIPVLWGLIEEASPTTWNQEYGMYPQHLFISRESCKNTWNLALKSSLHVFACDLPHKVSLFTYVLSEVLWKCAVLKPETRRPRPQKSIFISSLPVSWFVCSFLSLFLPPPESRVVFHLHWVFLQVSPGRKKLAATKHCSSQNSLGKQTKVLQTRAESEMELAFVIS